VWRGVGHLDLEDDHCGVVWCGEVRCGVGHLDLEDDHCGVVQ